jgi:diguanylate cyclase
LVKHQGWNADFTPVAQGTSEKEITATPVSWARRDLAALLYVGAAAVLVATAITLLSWHDGSIWLLAGGTVAGAFEIALALGCLARALGNRPERLASAVLGSGLLALAVGDILVNPASRPTAPSVAGGFSLLFYPLAGVALVLFLRGEPKRKGPTVWVDGVIIGLGVAAFCTALILMSVLGTVSGTPVSVAEQLARPVGDFILLALALGMVVMVPRRPARSLLFAFGCVLLVVGDIVALHHGSSGLDRVSSPLALLWPAAIMAMSASVWLPPPSRQLSPLAEKAPRVVVLALVVTGCLLLLILGNARQVSPVTLSLAGATLLASAARMALSLHQQRALNDSRRHQALTDELTGLGNRRYLLHELELALTDLAHSSPPASGVALLLIDLDHFKEINDSFGHQTGDELLRQIGPRIRQVVRRNDVVARLGGDEFAVLLYGSDASKATAVAQRLATLLEEPIDVSTASLHVGASIGVALAPDHAMTADDLIRCADIAMYRAKTERGSFDVYETALDDEADRFALIEDLRTAMNQGSLALHYQPEIDLRTGEVVTVEALLRWPHPTLGLIPPEHLLALAEESGLIHSLASWVFEAAIADCARWWHDGRHAAVAVNLLATDLLDSALPQRVSELLTRSDLPAHALVLEITEGMVVADLTRSKRVIQSLTDLGILVSIDDFGTGFSSLSHLNDLAVGELKLDRSFTSRLQTGETGGRDEDIVSSIINLGHALGLRVVAEGIERPEFVEVLATLGCDAGQGYAIQVPCPPADIDFGGFRRTEVVAAGLPVDPTTLGNVGRR